ncbi:hypothetical protein HDV00_004475 [Rhizophlyctis rosea]|nr:hypothetical protein HDV00_004475 [Rhizophlyctis rosea]
MSYQASHENSTPITSYLSSRRPAELFPCGCRYSPDEATYLLHKNKCYRAYIDQQVAERGPNAIVVIGVVMTREIVTGLQNHTLPEEQLKVYLDEFGTLENAVYLISDFLDRLDESDAPWEARLERKLAKSLISVAA